MKKYILFLATFCMISCKQGGDSQKEITNSSDSASAKISIDINLNGKQFKSLALPLTLDSAFISKCDTSDKLSYSFMRKMNCTFVNHDISHSLQNDLSKFCAIDSLKAAGKYKDYLAGLDIGMIRNSMAFTIGNLTFDNGGTLLLWGLNYESVDACPFAFSKAIVATYRNENNECISFMVARDLRELDPPVIANTLTGSTINNNGDIEIARTTIVKSEGKQRNESRQILLLKVEKEKLTIIGSK